MRDLRRATLTRFAHGLNRIENGGVDIRIAVRNVAEADAAADMHGFIAGINDDLADVCDQPFGPGVQIAAVATLDQRQERRSAEAACKIVGGQMRFQQRGKFAQYVFAGFDADFFLERGKFVEPDAGDGAQATRRGLREAVADRIDQRPALQ